MTIEDRLKQKQADALKRLEQLRDRVNGRVARLLGDVAAIRRDDPRRAFAEAAERLPGVRAQPRAFAQGFVQRIVQRVARGPKR